MPGSIESKSLNTIPPAERDKGLYFLARERLSKEPPLLGCLSLERELRAPYWVLVAGAILERRNELLEKAKGMELGEAVEEAAELLFFGAALQDSGGLDWRLATQNFFSDKSDEFSTAERSLTWEERETARHVVCERLLVTLFSQIAGLEIIRSWLQSHDLDFIEKMIKEREEKFGMFGAYYPYDSLAEFCEVSLFNPGYQTIKIETLLRHLPRQEREALAQEGQELDRLARILSHSHSVVIYPKELPYYVFSNDDPNEAYPLIKEMLTRLINAGSPERIVVEGEKYWMEQTPQLNILPSVPAYAYDIPTSPVGIAARLIQGRVDQHLLRVS